MCPDIEAITGEILGDAWKDSRDTLRDELFETPIASMLDRVEAVIREGGGYTKYLVSAHHFFISAHLLRPETKDSSMFHCLSSVLHA